MLYETTAQGCGGRLAFGSVILVYLVAYNETNGPTAIFSAILATFYALLTAPFKNELKHLQIPYIRATNKFDFFCIFMALWMEILSILSACAVLARTLSTCLDAMIGGLARILILGRNSSENEPWPDVIGVGIVFLVTGMFMLGLENTKAFSFVMTIGIIGTTIVTVSAVWLKGTTDEWNKSTLLSNGVISILSSSSFLVFAYPCQLANYQSWKRLIGIVTIFIVCIIFSLIAACLSFIVNYRSDKQYEAVPILAIFNNNDLKKLIPAAACLLVLSSSGAFLELFPELYNLIVRLSTRDWKILSRQIGYENSESGSPILAIFIGGSLCAMLAFACPMENLISILASSHLFSGILRAFFLLYSPFRPKCSQQNVLFISNDANLSYSRLTAASSNPRHKMLSNLNARFQNALKKPNKKQRTDEKVEREWLLLGEPSSPRPSTHNQDFESTILSDVDPLASDIECVQKSDNPDSDTSTDIDAIVDEYKQKLKVTTAGPMEKTIRVPTMSSWRITLLAILIIFLGIMLTVCGIFFYIPLAYNFGIAGILLVSTMMSFIPKYTGTVAIISPIISTSSLTLGSLMLVSCLQKSWPAILFWLCAGILLFIRCDKLCCSCFDKPITISTLSGKIATVRIPRQSRGVILSGQKRR